MKYLLLLLLITLTLVTKGNDTLIVGVKNTPPFIIKTTTGWDGASIDIIKMFENEFNKTIVYREVRNDNNSIIKAIKTKVIDLYIGDLSITTNRLNEIDFTQPYYSSGISIVTNKKPEVSFFNTLLNGDFWLGIIVLVLTIIVAGIIFWLFERNNNNNGFKDGWLGVFDGMYFSSFTMTTVGYGDVLKTKGGKITAIILMWVSIGIVGFQYANITTALTLTHFDISVSDISQLKKTKIGTILSTTSSQFLDDNNIKYIGFKTPIEALDALNEGSLTTFVYDTPALKYYLDKPEYNDLRLIDKEFKKEYYGFGLINNELRKEINPIISDLKNNPDWVNIKKKYSLD